jgi:hypothetical protein
MPQKCKSKKYLFIRIRNRIIHLNHLIFYSFDKNEYLQRLKSAKEYNIIILYIFYTFEALGKKIIFFTCRILLILFYRSKVE